MWSDLIPMKPITTKLKILSLGGNKSLILEENGISSVVLASQHITRKPLSAQIPSGLTLAADMTPHVIAGLQFLSNAGLMIAGKTEGEQWKRNPSLSLVLLQDPKTAGKKKEEMICEIYHVLTHPSLASFGLQPKSL
jgi:hypothetical protein